MIITGDCIEELAKLPDESLDCLITDPPYSSGARQANQLRGRGSMNRSEAIHSEWFGTDNLSSIGFMFFMRGVLLHCFRLLKPGAHAYVFIDWRNYPLLYQVMESAGFRVNNMVVWDKETMGMGDGYREYAGQARMRVGQEVLV